MFSVCCSRPEKFSHNIIQNDSEKMILNAPESQELNTSCGIGIAFKPNSKGSLEVRRLISGGSAEISGVVQVCIKDGFEDSPQYIWVGDCLSNAKPLGWRYPAFS